MPACTLPPLCKKNAEDEFQDIGNSSRKEAPHHDFSPGPGSGAGAFPSPNNSAEGWVSLENGDAVDLQELGFILDHGSTEFPEVFYMEEQPSSVPCGGSGSVAKESYGEITGVYLFFCF